MLMDGDSILPLCVVPYFDCDDTMSDDVEYGHKAPVLLDCFNQKYNFEWDLTVKRVSFSSIDIYNDTQCSRWFDIFSLF